MGLKVSVFTQLFLMALFFLSLFLSIFVCKDVYITEVVIIVTSLIMRILVVANKYATFSDFEIVLLKRFIQPIEYLNSKQIVFWINQDEDIVINQLTSCMRRNYFENQLSYVIHGNSQITVL